MPKNRSLNSPLGSGGTVDGSGVQIGDGVMLTAGHVMYEFNEEDDPALRATLTLSGSTLYWDPRVYLSQYQSIIGNLSNPLPTPPSGYSVSSVFIEGQLTSDDIVFVTRNGDVDDSDAGMALYLNPGDIVDPNGSLVSSARYRRWGQISFTKTVDWQTLSLSSIGLTWTDSSAHLIGGDSGGANWIEFEGREFIVGNNVSINQNSSGSTTHSNASYITSAEFYGLNTMLEASQSGDVTTSEPTNLIVGSAGSDTNAVGTFRADIILGKDNNDYLFDGDSASDTVWANDLLYGGGGDDSFTAGNGNDLIHGGDYRAYAGAASRTWNIEADGIDTVDYGSVIARSSDDPGLELRIGASAEAPHPTWVYGDTTDQALASYVFDRHTGAAQQDQIGIDALISIENVTLTGSDDTLTINEIAGARWAGQDGTGGIASIDFAGNATFDGTSENPGDLVDASNLGASDDVRIDLDAGIVSAVPGNGPNGQNIPSISILGAESAYGGAGDDRLTGDAGSNRLDGGAGSDQLDGGAGDDFIVFEEADASVDGGAGFDTAILFAGTDQSGNAIGATFDAHRLGISNFERLIGTEGDDTISVSNGDYVVNGGGGDDFIEVSGRDPVTIEFGRGGGHDFVEGLFMENHDLNAPTLHGVGTNQWFDKRQNDTIKFVDLMPSDVTVVWDFSEQGPDLAGTRRDGGFAIIINDTGESIQFAELFTTRHENIYGKYILADYGPVKGLGGDDISEQDPDNYNYKDPSLWDNLTELKIFEFSDGSRLSIVELEPDLDLIASSPLPFSRANPNTQAASSTALITSTSSLAEYSNIQIASSSSDEVDSIARNTRSWLTSTMPDRDTIFEMLRENRSEALRNLFETGVAEAQSEPAKREAQVEFGLVRALEASNSNAAEASQLASANAELSRKLAMIRQDMGAFGASWSGEVDRIYQPASELHQLYA